MSISREEEIVAELRNIANTILQLQVELQDHDYHMISHTLIVAVGWLTYAARMIEQNPFCDPE